MPLVLIAVAVLVISGLAALLLGRLPRWSSVVGVGGAVIGSVIGFIQSLHVLILGNPVAWTFSWSVPFGSLSIEIDSLSALFLLPILGLSALAALYGQEYLADWRDRKSLGAMWMYFNALVASMILVVIARNAVLFLVTWELMSLASYFLVVFEHEKEDVQRAGWIYLVATHIGTAFLFALFVLLGAQSGSLDFSTFQSIPGAAAGVLFLLAVIGFGTKAGFMPLHVWLPDAHPAAPSHVSALMSGVMIKTGIYGLVRVLTFLGPPEPWWGFVLIGVGLTSGVIGVLFALAQHDIKRLLAYSTVENAGIIAMGLGLGLLGWSYQEPAVAIAGFAGALLHVVNHAVFKGLLFFGAGAVAHATGSRDINRLGGLLKRMPWTGSAFLVGSSAICGLPPLNGFVSEWLIYLGAFQGALSKQTGVVMPALGLVIGLALIGGLAAACFIKAFGMAFLGEPRSEPAAHAHEVGRAMRIPMLVLAATCVAIGLASPRICLVVIRLVGDIAGVEPAVLANVESNLKFVLSRFVVASVALIGLAGVIIVLRRRLLNGRDVAEDGTWDCGYLKPDARMQYTASSFVQPLTEHFHLVLGTRARVSPPRGFFPKDASFISESMDVFKDRLFKPAFTALESAVERMRWLQHGRLQLYVLYIAVTLLVLLIWKL
jgi:hydrogenase-4 component B